MRPQLDIYVGDILRNAYDNECVVTAVDHQANLFEYMMLGTYFCDGHREVNTSSGLTGFCSIRTNEWRVVGNEQLPPFNGHHFTAEAYAGFRKMMDKR
jgi:hypothetical protein